MSRSRSRRRLFAALALAAGVALVVRFFVWRAADRNAWPSPAAAVAVETPGVATGPAGPVPGVDADAAASLLAALPAADHAPAADYRAFQDFGRPSLSPDAVSRLCARWLSATNAPASHLPEAVPVPAAFPDDPFGASARWFAVPAAFAGFAPGPDGGPSEAASGFVARSGEQAALWAFLAFEGSSPAVTAEALGAGAEAFLRAYTRGAGLPGRAAALAATMLFCREALMLACDPATQDGLDWGGAVRAFRAADGADGPLAESVREDALAVRAAVRAVYATLERREPPPPGARRPGPASGWFVRLLGGSEETTIAHLDALFSRLAENASAPPSPDGLVAGLPAWCREGGRPPWTRDPVGASVAQGVLRHARVAAALGPCAALETRAARVALALRAWRDAHGGAWPEALDALLEPGAAGPGEPLLCADDLADPFSPDAEPLRYARDGDGWRLWSVGIDRIDGGGAVDAFTGGKEAAAGPSDFVYTSREREIRKAFHDANAARRR